MKEVAEYSHISKRSPGLGVAAFQWSHLCQPRASLRILKLREVWDQMFGGKGEA